MRFLDLDSCFGNNKPNVYQKTRNWALVWVRLKHEICALFMTAVIMCLLKVGYFTSIKSVCYRRRFIYINYSDILLHVC